jgi:hypothetical protein
MEIKEQYQVEISNKFACLENLNHIVDINGTLNVLERISKF